MSVDPFLIIVVVAMIFVIFVAVGILIVKFSHPDDKNQAYFPKVVTALGLFLAFASILVLPYDVANTKGDGGGIEIEVLWQIIYFTMAIFIGFLIPFAFFYYESDVDEETAETCCDSQFGIALAYTFGFSIAFITILVLMFAFLNTAEIPVVRIAQNVALVVNIADPVPNTTAGCTVGCIESVIKLDIPVTFPVYVIAFLGFLGWFFFTLFVGVGLMALPMDLINEFRTRPQPMPITKYTEAKIDLGKRAQFLVEIGKGLEHDNDSRKKSRAQKRQIKADMRRFEKAYYYLKHDYAMLEMSRDLKDSSFCWNQMKLVLGIISIGLSLTWVLHIALFLLPDEPVDPFLNTLFIELEEAFDGFSLLGVTAFAIYSFYLLWCVVKGNFKIGMRFIIFKIYPMELGNTLMNAFLANTWVILVCSIPAVQFSVRAFPIYARFTSINMIFGTQIQHLQFFRYFFEQNVFVIALLVVAFLTLCFLVLSPSDRSVQIQKQLNEAAQKSLAEGLA